MAKLSVGTSSGKRTFARGGGILSNVLNKAIDLLPFEAHLPSYRFCGPGTRLKERLERGDKGINPLDEACKLHDIEYTKYSDSENRSRADKQLAERAWARVKSSDASLGERAAALVVTGGMKAKTMVGKGVKKQKRSHKQRKNKCNCGGGLFLKPYPKRSGKGLKKKKTNKKKQRSH